MCTVYTYLYLWRPTHSADQCGRLLVVFNDVGHQLIVQDVVDTNLHYLMSMDIYILVILDDTDPFSWYTVNIQHQLKVQDECGH